MKADWSCCSRGALRNEQIYHLTCKNVYFKNAVPFRCNKCNIGLVFIYKIKITIYVRIILVEHYTIIR